MSALPMVVDDVPMVMRNVPNIARDDRKVAV